MDKAYALKENETPVAKEGLWAEDIEAVTYTGKALKPVVTVYDGDTLLKLNKDYKVKYSENKNVGKATVTITGKGNYEGSITKEFEIVAKNLADKDIVAENLYVYASKNTNAVKVSPVVTRDEKKLKVNKDYVVECPDETEGAYVKPGTYKVTVRAKENSGYIGSKDCRPEIRWYRKNTGTAIRPTVDIDNLEEGKNYTVEYMDNVEVGKATVLVKGINDYTGTVKKTFKITPFDISKNTGDSFKVVSESITVAYAKGGSKPSVEVTFNGTDMVEGVDYTLSYKNNKKVGDTKKTPEITIKGKGNFKGTKSGISFTIVKQDIGNLNATAQDIVVKNAAKYNKVVPVIVDLDGKKLKKGTDFVITGYTYADGSEITTTPGIGAVIQVTAEGKGNYEKTITAQFKVIANDKNIAAAKIEVKDQTYTGKEIKPAGEAVTVKVKVKEGSKTVWKDLTEGVDYEIVEDGYSKNINKGTAKLTVRGIGEYGGTKTASFKIKAQTMSWADWYKNTMSWLRGIFQ